MPNSIEIAVIAPAAPSCDTLAKNGGTTLRRKILIAGFALAGALAFAQMKSGILHPEMKVENGTYQKPMATLGTKPSEPWSTTSVAAGVDRKPQPGTPVTVVGEVVDFSCYMQLGKHGEKHRACGQKCVQNGQAIGLLT